MQSFAKLDVCIQCYTISLRRAICRFRENKKVFHVLFCRMTQNQETNQETLDCIAEELKDLEPEQLHNFSRAFFYRSYASLFSTPWVMINAVIK